MQKQWDVFLSYSRADCELVEGLARKLREKAHLNLYLDRWNLVPGDPWQEALETALQSTSVCAVCIGPTGLGPWQNEEMRLALQIRLNQRELRVIPVFLPGCSESSSSGVSFLDRLSRVHFRSGLDDDGIDALIAGIRGQPPGDPGKALQPGRTSWEHYDWLFEINEFRLPYLPLINFPKTDVVQRGLEAILCDIDDEQFTLSADFQDAPVPRRFVNRPSCRLNSYRIGTCDLAFRFGRTSYEDYLKSGEQLDRPNLRQPGKTFRDVFGRLIMDRAMNLRPFPLTNICGCGVFVRTNDDKLVATTHSVDSHVYPGRSTFTASGVMRWALNPDPFSQIVRRSWEELSFQLSLRELMLVTFGADARKLYFQFGFLKKYPGSFSQFQRDCKPGVALRPIDLDPSAIAEEIVSGCWEPAAEACLLTISALEYESWGPVIEALGRHRDAWALREMKDEWDYRAWQPGRLPDMSVRYPAEKLGTGSRVYISQILKFVRPVLPSGQKRVVEVGAGTGRVTAVLVGLAAELTVVDLCPRMLQLNQRRLGARAHKVKEYIVGFGQRVLSGRHFDVAVCCLVLIHNVSDEQFINLVHAMCNAVSTVIVCEDVTEQRPTSARTKLRTEEDIRSAFAQQDFDLVNQHRFFLFDDRLWLAQFDRRRL